MTDVTSSYPTPRDAIYVRDDFVAPQPPPSSTVGPLAWGRQRLFSSPLNSAITIVTLLLIAWILPPMIKWLFIDAVWTGEDRTACLPAEGQEVGACWAFIRAKFGQILFGRYPIEERWRVELTGLIFVVGLVALAVPRIPYKNISAYLMLVVFPIVGFFLLYGGTGFNPIPLTVVAAILLVVAFMPRLGFGRPARWALGLVLPLLVADAVFGAIHLPEVETSLWGGLMVTLVVAVTGIVASLPLGILLALGRRSNLPVVKFASVVFIEFWRGVPLITVLFMASVMLPLFLPAGVNFDKLLRALIGVALFSAAYMAETVRAGLQAIPKGQYEAAAAMGLGYWPAMRLVVLPQALKIVIPGIVNSFISLFKDTSLVLIIGLFDLLGIIQFNFQDANWSTPNTAKTGFVFAALVFWVFCFGMSRYSQFMERRLNTGRRR